MTSVNETNAFEARRRNRDGGIGSIVAVLAVAVSVVLGASIAAPVQGAALTAGDAFRVNFAPTGSALGGDWNNMDANSSISAGSVQLFGGGGATTIDGVGLSINGTGSANDTNTQGWGGWTSSPADPYYTAAAYPLVYSVNAGLGLTGKANELNLTVSGLDTSLRYNVRAYFLINETLADFDIRVTDGAGSVLRTGINRITAYTTLSSPSDPLYADLIFENVSADALGNLIVSVGASESVSLQGFALEAITQPVPGAGLAGLATLGLAGVARRRRR
jgi:hypothetical protein